VRHNNKNSAHQFGREASASLVVPAPEKPQPPDSPYQNTPLLCPALRNRHASIPPALTIKPAVLRAPSSESVLISAPIMRPCLIWPDIRHYSAHHAEKALPVPAPLSSCPTRAEHA